LSLLKTRGTYFHRLWRFLGGHKLRRLCPNKVPIFIAFHRLLGGPPSLPLWVDIVYGWPLTRFNKLSDMLNSKWLKKLWTNFLEIYNSTTDFASIFIKVMQLSMFSIQIPRNFFLYTQNSEFREISSWNSNFSYKLRLSQLFMNEEKWKKSWAIIKLE
jgi:hypothetical protein